MNHELKILDYMDTEVRIVIIDNEPWWVLKDICKVLGLSTPARVSERLEEYEVSLTHLIDSIGRKQDTTIINESGLYNVILRSDKPNAKDFRKWVTSKVLPSIRKTGTYMTPESMYKALSTPEGIIKMLETMQELHSQNQLLSDTAKVQEQYITVLEPKANYCDIILSTPDTINITVIAKDYGMSAIEMNKLLHTMRIQYKQKDIWLLYKRYDGKGYTSSETYSYLDGLGQSHSAVRTKWTQQGRLFLYDKLKAEGYLPIIERQPHLSIVPANL